MAPKKLKVTKAARGELILSRNQYIVQSNRITDAQFPDFNLYLSRIFECLIKQLQAAIQADMNGHKWQQLGLFEEPDSFTLRVGIPLSEITNTEAYKDVIACFAYLKTVDYTIQSPYSKNHILHTSLISEFEEPKKDEGNPTVFIHIQKELAKNLIMVAKNEDGKPIMFPNLLYDVLMAAKKTIAEKV